MPFLYHPSLRRYAQRFLIDEKMHRLVALEGMTEIKEEDKFTQLLGLAHTEELIRFRRRSEKRGLLKMAESLTAEIEQREKLEAVHKKK